MRHLLVMFAFSLAAAAGKANDTRIHVLFLCAYLGNAAWFWFEWQKVKLAPPSPIVPRRIRFHLRLLRAARALLLLGLFVSTPVAVYMISRHHSRAAYPVVAGAILCPVILMIKMRWLTMWQRRLQHKSQALS